MSRAELILYATPEGPLADALVQLFDRLRREAPSTAQSYPPHCTLTGFFQRPAGAILRIRDEAARAVERAGAPRGEPVAIESLHHTPTWVGLELASSWLESVTTAFVALHEADPGDDALRPKDWLHLSIAYGIDDLSAAEAIVADLDLTLPVTWRIGLWQRHVDGSWTHHNEG